MAAIKIILRPAAIPGKEGKLYFQIIHENITRQIDSGYRIFVSEWNADYETIRCPSNDNGRAVKLCNVAEGLGLGRKRLENVISTLRRNGMEFTANDIVRHYDEQKTRRSLTRAMKSAISMHNMGGRPRTAETYASTLRSFMRFRRGKDVQFDEITPALITHYEAWLLQQELTLNTVSFYMRILRAVYNEAVFNGLTEQLHPFKTVYTGIEKTAKRAIRLVEVKRIQDLKLLRGTTLAFARDMFIFSFYTRGMSFVDMAFLRKSDLQDGILTYRRHKTGRILNIRWEKPMQQIIDRYDTTATPYLLPIIVKADADERMQYRSALRLVNKKLKIVAEMAGLSVQLSTYFGRHSWANAARCHNIPLAIISEGMGHRSENTTMIYLNSIENTLIDRANRKILSIIS